GNERTRKRRAGAPGSRASGDFYDLVKVSRASTEAADGLLLSLRELEDRRQSEKVEDLLHVRRRVQEDDVPAHVLRGADRPDEDARAGRRDVVEPLELDDELVAVLAEQGGDEILHLLERMRVEEALRLDVDDAPAQR